MSTRPGRSGLVANEKIESSGLYSAVYLVPGGASSSYSGDCSLDDCEEEGKPLLSSSEITSDSIKRNKMAENAPKTTPGLNETVQEFKAREDRDPEGLNSDVRVSYKYFYDKKKHFYVILDRKCPIIAIGRPKMANNGWNSGKNKIFRLILKKLLLNQKGTIRQNISGI